VIDRRENDHAAVCNCCGDPVQCLFCYLAEPLRIKGGLVILEGAPNAAGAAEGQFQRRPRVRTVKTLPAGIVNSDLSAAGRYRRDGAAAPPVS
jgi:hypothetical protein